MYTFLGWFFYCIPCNKDNLSFVGKMFEVLLWSTLLIVTLLWAPFSFWNYLWLHGVSCNWKINYPVMISQWTLSWFSNPESTDCTPNVIKIEHFLIFSLNIPQSTSSLPGVHPDGLKISWEQFHMKSIKTNCNIVIICNMGFVWSHLDVSPDIVFCHSLSTFSHKEIDAVMKILTYFVIWSLLRNSVFAKSSSLANEPSQNKKLMIHLIVLYKLSSTTQK